MTLMAELPIQSGDDVVRVRQRVRVVAADSGLSLVDQTKLVTEKLLETLVATGADHAVLDITGVPTVDTEVAQHLLKTVHAARLLGAECIISGIRPQVAQTIVSLGIEFGDIATKATLADALRHALTRTGLKVTEADPA